MFKNAERLRLKTPIISNAELSEIKKIDLNQWKTKVIDLVYLKSLGTEGMLEHIENICKEAEQAIEEGYSFIVLSDKNINKENIQLTNQLVNL